MPIYLEGAIGVIDPMACAADTQTLSIRFAAGYRPEAHNFSSGGHGFGTLKKGKSGDPSIDSFYYWLQAQGYAKRTAQ